ncbi:unnamed protein product [Durusdinium trenchii]|uniref:Calpain catalytic domain-containing protein n=2 Tax=Durusdinium trenchii TaxID=1381693 RepID=A0ABP0KLZ5_9DINO
MLDFDELEEIETQLRASFPDVKTDQVTDVKVPPGQELRIFLISDLHVDYKQNKEWMYRCLQSLSHESSDGRRFFDCLLLPGDLCTSEDLFEEVMKTLKARFHKVFFCFGNHEAWIRGEKKGNTPAKDSFEKLERIHEICKDLGVYTSPVRLLHGSSNPGSRPSSNGVSSIILLPLLSWYHSSWDTERDLPTDLQPPMDPGQRISDFRQCRWSSLEGEKGFAFGQGGVTSTHIAEYFAQRNEVWIKEVLELQSREGGEILSSSTGRVRS